MKLNALIKLGITAAILASCGSDDNEEVMNPNPGTGGGLVPSLEVPATYVFERNGESTVNFSGQTLRLAQGAQILKDLTNFDARSIEIQAAFAGDFGADSDLTDSKNVKGKTAESLDIFRDTDRNVVDALRDPVVNFFDSLIADQGSELLEAFNSAGDVPAATPGQVGVLVSANSSARYVNAKGIENNQYFNKGLIGAFTLDQVINDYLSLVTQATPEQLAAHEAETPRNDTSVDTQLEHFWDEAYGYVYGASDADVLDNPNSRHLTNENSAVNDAFLYKYVQRVNKDADFNTIGDEVFEAFKTGRAALVANDYEVVSEQANIIRELLSEVIAIRAVFYLQQGKVKARNNATVEDGSAFHDLSEGIGFVYSLQFTQDPTTGKPYFTVTEVEEFLEELESGNGFWKYTDATNTELDRISEAIASKFDFTVAQAAK